MGGWYFILILKFLCLRRMTLHRFFCDNDFFAGKTVIIDNAEIAHQLRKVLRLRANDVISIFNSRRREFYANIIEYKGESVVLKIGAEIRRESESLRDVVICQSLLSKSDLFEEVLRHGTELGAAGFIPIISRRVHQPFLKKIERLQKIIKEAAEQSERIDLPGLADAIDIRELMLKEWDGLKIMLVAREEGVNFSVGEFKDYLKKNKNNKIEVLVGPEGGFTDEEILEAQNNGFKTLNLGKRILRSETAALYFLAAVDFYGCED